MSNTVFDISVFTYQKGLSGMWDKINILKERNKIYENLTNIILQ